MTVARVFENETAKDLLKTKKLIERFIRNRAVTSGLNVDNLVGIARLILEVNDELTIRQIAPATDAVNVRSTETFSSCRSGFWSKLLTRT